MRRGLSVVALAVLAAAACGCRKKTEEVVDDGVSGSMVSSPRAASSYLGTSACVSCHEEQHRDWLGSHHDLAMQKPTPQTVLGDFNDVRIKYYDEIVRFVRDGDGFAIDALGADGKAARFPVVYTFGVEPLQQYLLEVEPGRLQAFAFAWDTRPKARGGQRWFHLHPREHIEPGDALHWTGPSYNWNHACADCHSTAVRKGYDRASKRYRTEYVEINVGCEACHGPGSRHAELVEAKTEPFPADGGFNNRLPPSVKREWSFADGRDIATLTASPPSDEPEACAPCHSRRADLGGDRGEYHGRYRLATLDELLYFDDGQIRDEVYEYGSFLQSKMHAAGVICSDCHDGHSGALRAQGNALCTRCHRAKVFDDPQHHFHATGTPGSLCTDCHMPRRTYMGIDDRGDHRLGLPRPALAERIGAPDPCTACHRGRSQEWAERHIAAHFPARAAHPFAEAFHAARSQRPGGEAALVELVGAGSTQPIVRATALLELRNLGSPALPALLRRVSQDGSPIVRRSVATAARELPPEQRDSIVRPMLRDPTRAVRVEAVAVLLGRDAGGWSESDREALKDATAEYIEARSFNADRGEGLVDLAHVATLAGDYERAEEDLREALEIDPTFTAAYVNLADLYRIRQRDQEAEAVLHRGLKAATDRAAIEFALGLTLVRLGRRTEAMAHLRRAYEIRPEVIRFGNVYAIAQYDLGRQEAALGTLGKLHERYPANREVLRLLLGYNREMGRAEAAERYAAELERMKDR